MSGQPTAPVGDRSAASRGASDRPGMAGDARMPWDGAVAAPIGLSLRDRKFVEAVRAGRRLPTAERDALRAMVE